MNLIEMSEKIKNRSDILHHYNSWIEPFVDYMQKYYDKNLITEQLTDLEWRTYLSRFLFSQEGGKHQASFGFIEKLRCGQLIPNISVSSFNFKFRRFKARDDYVPAMHSLNNIVSETNVTATQKFVWGKVFGNWITDEIIDEEVLRNISLALICVMFCTGILITNFQICFWIFVCVLLTLLNVSGFMYLWGLTIDLVSCIALQLAVGLCVDYAAHVGHTFLTINDKSRTKRAIETVSHIGAAVLYGGTSTVLGLAMLVGSEAYVFKAFFKIFLLVVIFGLFHGIVLLPVILSLIGPKPYQICDKNDINRRNDGGDDAADHELLNINKNDIKIIPKQNSNLLNGNDSDDKKY